MRILDPLHSARTALDRWKLSRVPLPAGFDWVSYLDRYPDLRQAGISTESHAIAHWRRYGAGEGRWSTRPSYPTRETLVCQSVHSLYLRATGTLVCWDDAGNDTVLQAFDENVQYGHDVYLGEPFQRIRRLLWEGRMPFEVCRRCAVLRSRTPHSSYHVDNRVIEIFQVEPSFRCTLDCPGCVRLDQRRLAPPRNLPIAMFEKIVRDLADAHVTVRAFDFEGHGEPTLHPGLWALTRLAREIHPTTYITMATNAQAVLKDDILGAGLDSVVCGIDGVDQETYEPYRIHGDFDLAYRFVRRLTELAPRSERPIRVFWKYILFEHNSSPRHLERLRKLAREAKVDEVVLVFTRNGPRSTRLEHPDQVPVKDWEVEVSFRYHEPDVSDLSHRLEESRLALERGDAAEANELAGSVISNLRRFLRDARDATAEHERLGATLAELVAELDESNQRGFQELRETLGGAWRDGRISRATPEESSSPHERGATPRP
jgi:wyosine [tRNA(Phe)-imidazoG37] synthetase (radical SAM superfamily)